MYDPIKKVTYPDTLEALKGAARENVCLDGVPDKLYFAFEAMSNGGMKEFKKAPGYWKYSRESTEDTDTPARLKGRLMHMALNEPRRFETDVAIIDGNRNANAVKDEIYTAQQAGKTVCKSADANMAQEVAKFCRAHPLVSNILKSGKGEQTFLWKDPTTGAQCKARADWVTPTGVIIDWKSFDHVYSDDKLEKQIRDMGYQFQSAWYLEAYFQVHKKPARAFYHGFIRIDEPYDIAVRKIADQSVDEAMPYIRAIVERFSGCQKTNTWPMTPAEVNEIVLKPYWS